MLDDEWGFCDQCGKLAVVFWEIDPYYAELCPEDEHEPSWWCRRCHEKASDDI